jgi:Glycosyl transferase family 2
MATPAGKSAYPSRLGSHTPAALPETVTACLIVRDEEERLPGALESVAFCDEVVVVDSGSTDRTVEIARAAGARVIENAWPGYGAQRNVALEHASSDWILEIDADERILTELQREIRRFIDDPPPGYDIGAFPQFHRFLGAELRMSMKYPNYRTRLFRRGAYRHDESRTVHEGIWPTGPVWPFEGEMSHELAGSWPEAVRDMWNYARLEASVLARPESPLTLVVGALVRPAAKFGYRVVVDGGWRDGVHGVLRIALECLSDALVWIRRSLHGPTGAAPSGHFAAGRPLGWGTPVVIGVASGARAAERTGQWLERAKAEGIDVALVTDAPPADGTVRIRPLHRFGPLLLARGLEAERQLRGQADALLVDGAAAQMLMRLIPATLQGRHAQLARGSDPASAKRSLSAAVEGSRPGG